MSVATSNSGWTSDFIASEWFEKIFIPQANAHNSLGKPIILIYDRHQSHETIRLHQLAEQYGIHLFCLPAHTTHQLQPLDIGIFGPLQCAWQKWCGDYLEDCGKGISKKNVTKEYINAQNKSFKTETILKAWEKCSIWPINPGIFTEQDYALSFEMSTTIHVLPSYPLEWSPDDEEESADESEYLSSETETETNDKDVEGNGGEKEIT